MVSAWHKQLSGAAVCIGLLTSVFASGCQSWSNLGAPMQSATRVPPPGTGSYNLQGAYYNNPATATTSHIPNPSRSVSAAPVVQASATSDPVNPTGANFPTSPYAGGTSVNFASTNTNNSAAFENRSQGVSTAGYTDSGNSGAQVISASAMQMSDRETTSSAPTEATNLQWK